MGRNEHCYCGSGKKYKNCHLSSDQRENTQIEQQEKSANLNRQNEPNYVSGMGVEGYLATRGFSRAKDLSKKDKKE